MPYTLFQCNEVKRKIMRKTGFFLTITCYDHILSIGEDGFKVGSCYKGVRQSAMKSVMTFNRV